MLGQESAQRRFCHLSLVASESATQKQMKLLWSGSLSQSMRQSEKKMMDHTIEVPPDVPPTNVSVEKVVVTEEEEAVTDPRHTLRPNRPHILRELP